MCEYCGRRIHAPGCPNAPEREALHMCDYCKENIFFGDTFINVNERCFHEGCFFDYLSCINEDDILCLFELRVEIAGDGCC